MPNYNHCVHAGSSTQTGFLCCYCACQQPIFRNYLPAYLQYLPPVCFVPEPSSASSLSLPYAPPETPRCGKNWQSHSNNVNHATQSASPDRPFNKYIMLNVFCQVFSLFPSNTCPVFSIWKKKYIYKKTYSVHCSASESPYLNCSLI